jgi:hypothetical protein
VTAHQSEGVDKNAAKPIVIEIPIRETCIEDRAEHCLHIYGTEIRYHRPQDHGKFFLGLQYAGIVQTRRCCFCGETETAFKPE